MENDGPTGPPKPPNFRWTVVALAAAGACASPLERSTIADLQSVDRQLSELPSDDKVPQAVELPFDGSVSAYTAYAFAKSPALRATFEDWRAATYRPSQERRLPEPTITYAGFIRAVETRVGPQQHRLGVKQWLPWPTKLNAGGAAASLEAQAAQRRFEAHALRVSAAIASDYWALWRVQRLREVARVEVEIVSSLSMQVRTRVEVSMADLADLAQVNLRVSRARDRLEGMDEAERIASARLVSVLGAPDGTATPIAPHPPSIDDVDESVEVLTADAAAHPSVASFAALSDASVERVREARADRFPSFGIGADWIFTGRSQAAMAPTDSGKDAAMLSLSVKVPLWGRAYKAGENEARARGAAFRARSINARNMVAADVRQQVARVDDDVRRVQTYETTLIPQAEAAFESVLSSYAAGRSTIGELLSIEGELVGLQAELYAAQADYGVHLANLERAVGRPVRTKGKADAKR